MNEAVEQARALLETLTPLKRDCGRLCGARCCRSLEGEETGMVLFPGEEEAYDGLEGWSVKAVKSGESSSEDGAPEDKIVICPGTCARERRPLSCRLFPLLPEIGPDGGVRVWMDQRARAVCPLSRQGVSALDPDFAAAVKTAGELLAADEESAAVLARLTKENQELREIRKRWTR